MVAVAIRLPGFTTMPELIGPFAFHIVTNLLGLQLLNRVAPKPAEDAQTGEAAAA